MKCIKSKYVQPRKRGSRAKQLGTYFINKIAHDKKTILIGSLSGPNFAKQTADFAKGGLMLKT